MAIEYRRNINNATQAQVNGYQEALSQIKQISDTRGFSHIAGLHGAPGGYCWHHQRRAGVLEGVRLFLPWHRAYLYRYEQALQDRVAGVTVPWWDWRSTDSRNVGLPAAFTQDEFNGVANPLHKSVVNIPSAGLNFETERFPLAPGDLPDENAVTTLIEDHPQWADFNDALEDMHDQIHGWVGGYRRDANGWPLDVNGNRVTNPNSNPQQMVWGTMGSTTAAAFDPVFWSHHAMIDRIWSLWQLKYGNGGIPLNVLDLVLEPFSLRVRDVLTTHDLGYEYASTASPTPGP